MKHIKAVAFQVPVSGTYCIQISGNSKDVEPEIEYRIIG